MMVKNILIVLIFTSIQKCWTCIPPRTILNEEVRLSTVLKNQENTFERSNDYGFYLGDFTEETVRNGEETIPHQYPWMVFVCGRAYIDSAGGLRCNESCGGTLIHSQYVLTAAHCVAGGTIDDTFVVIGAHNINHRIKILNWSDLTDILLHPDYDPTKHDEFKRSPDVAILKLNESVVFGPKVNAISLPDLSQVDKDYENEHAIVAGWGVKDYDKKNTPITSPDKLMDATVKIRSNSWCKGRGNLHFIQSFHLCTYPENPLSDPSSTCKGDSGGPLMMRDEKNGGRWMVIAVTSFRVTTHKCGLTEAGFTKITSSVLSWIKTVLNSPATVVISSNGGAAQHVGGALGQFDYDQDKECYVQKIDLSKLCESVKREDCQNPSPRALEKLAVYLYSDDDDRWHVNNSTDEKVGWLYNPISSKTLPTSGWMYSDGKSWQSDVTLSVNPGPLMLPSQFTVTAALEEPALDDWSAKLSEWSSKCLGVFYKTEMWWRGRPMYFNFNDNKEIRTDNEDCQMFLHHGPGDYGWVIGAPGYFAIFRGSRARNSPADESSWRYIKQLPFPELKENLEWKPALVNITGSDK